MGKRKRATKPPPKKKRGKLDRVFDCPFCGHEQTVECFLERDVSIGRVECRICSAKYRSIISHLDEEIDLYHKWIDACEEASKEKSAGTRSTAPGASRPSARASLDDVDIEDEDEDDIPE